MSALLSIEDMTKGYSRGGEWEPVFEKVSLEVVCGEIVAIIGGRFEGKTTMLKIAAGIERPDTGAVRLNNQALSALVDRPREVRWIDRDGPGLEVAVAEFVGWPLAPQGRKRRQAERVAAQMLEEIGAKECVGLQWGELSSWQRVQVGLARGFVGAPQLVVIDDLLDALGEPRTEQASDLMRSLVERSQPRCAVLMGASDMESAMFADRVLSITGKHSLRVLSGRLTDHGEVVPLRRRADADGP